MERSTGTTLQLARQQGAAIIEFALIAVIFLTLIFAIADFGRILYTWNAVDEATRLGARVAVVCDKLSPDQVRSRMKAWVPQLSNANIVINWYDPEGTVNNSCTAATCKGVEVSVTGFTLQPISPLMGIVMPPVPPFKTYLPRESMEAVNAAGDSNPVCM